MDSKPIIKQADPDIYIEKKGWGYKENNRISKQFVLRKTKRYRWQFKARITKDGKNKNDKDEIGNILLKHMSTSL